MKHRRRHMKKFSAEVLLESGKVDAVVAIGCLVKGSTRLMEACGLSWSTTLHFARAIVHNILTYLYLVFFLWLDSAYSCQLSGWSEIWETREFDWFIIESKQISDASTEKRITKSCFCASERPLCEAWAARFRVWNLAIPGLFSGPLLLVVSFLTCSATIWRLVRKEVSPSGTFSRVPCYRPFRGPFSARFGSTCHSLLVGS